MDFKHIKFYSHPYEHLKEGDVWCYKLNNNMYHTFLIYKIISEDNVQIIHFNTQMIKENMFKINKKFGKVPYSNPINDVKTRKAIAYSAYRHFYDWGHYHIVFNNCHHFIHYCLYNEKPLLCGQNKIIIPILGASLLGVTALIGMLFR